MQMEGVGGAGQSSSQQFLLAQCPGGVAIGWGGAANQGAGRRRRGSGGRRGGAEMNVWVGGPACWNRSFARSYNKCLAFLYSVHDRVTNLFCFRKEIAFVSL